MQLRALTQRIHPWRTGITVYLLHSLPPLLLGLRVKVLFRQVFQLHYVAMPGLIMRQVGQQEEITIPMIQFHFGSGDVITVQTQVSHEEALDAALALYGVADGGQVTVTVGDEQHTTEMTPLAMGRVYSGPTLRINWSSVMRSVTSGLRAGE